MIKPNFNPQDSQKNLSIVSFFYTLGQNLLIFLKSAIKEIRIFLKSAIKEIRKSLRDFGTKYPELAQRIQLSSIYFFAIVDLLYAILSNIFSLGYLPEVVLPTSSIFTSILESPILQIWASPEKVFFLSYVVIEFMIVRPAFEFTVLVKYNVLLIFALLMIQGVVISYWDLLFHREIASSVEKWAYDQGVIVHTDKTLAILFFLLTFMFFIVMYYYFYRRATEGVLPKVSGMYWLTDSISFWLRIETSTMRFGTEEEGKKKNKRK